MDKNADRLPAIVFSMEQPFTYDDIITRLKEDKSYVANINQGINVDELWIGVYLNRLKRLDILKHRGNRFWFCNIF